MTFSISIGPNLRKSPYFDATVADGVKAFSVYNHMYIPSHFGRQQHEYEHLIDGVVMWDVAAQRQVEICGPDASKLVHFLSARDLSTTRIGQGRYVPICNHQGQLINDPVLLKLAADRYWLSIADSDIELWASAIAGERDYNVNVFEADASPLAVQGPLAEKVVARLFGEWVCKLKYFEFKQTALDDIPLVLARSGWSKQGGFELYLQDGTRGTELWEKVKAAGIADNIIPGAPNDIERIESGLLSYGADGRLQVHPVNPFEVGLGSLIDVDSAVEYVGKQALKSIKANGVRRTLTGFFVESVRIDSIEHSLQVFCGNKEVGYISEIVFSPRLRKSIALGVIDVDQAENKLSIILNGKNWLLTKTELPFVQAAI